MIRIVKLMSLLATTKEKNENHTFDQFGMDRLSFL